MPGRAAEGDVSADAASWSSAGTAFARGSRVILLNMPSDYANFFLVHVVLAAGPRPLRRCADLIRYGLAAGSESATGAPAKISAAMRVVSIAAGTPQYIATSSSTSCTCALV